MEQQLNKAISKTAEKALVEYETEYGKVKLSPETVKRYLVNGDASRVTEQEIVLFMMLCKYQGLNPFLREAYLIKYGDSPATIVTGKDTFTKRATKDPNCSGYESGIVVEKDGQLEYRKGTLVLKNETLVGGWARVFRKDWQVPLENTVALSEYVRYNNKGELQKNWRDMPATMIRKVALVQALREAIPKELGGLYSPEEMPIDDSKLESKPIEITAKAISEPKAEPKAEPMTDKQQGQICALIKELSIAKDEMKQLLYDLFKIKSSQELTERQATELIKHLESLKNNSYAAYESPELQAIPLPWEVNAKEEGQ